MFLVSSPFFLFILITESYIFAFSSFFLPYSFSLLFFHSLLYSSLYINDKIYCEKVAMYVMTLSYLYCNRKLHLHLFSLPTFLLIITVRQLFCVSFSSFTFSVYRQNEGYKTSLPLYCPVNLLSLIIIDGYKIYLYSYFLSQLSLKDTKPFFVLSSINHSSFVIIGEGNFLEPSNIASPSLLLKRGTMHDNITLSGLFRPPYAFHCLREE